MAESPDLSALPDPPLHPQHQQYRGSFSHPSSASAYHPPPFPSESAFGTGSAILQEPEQLQLGSQQEHSYQHNQQYIPPIPPQQPYPQLPSQAVAPAAAATAYVPPTRRPRLPKLEPDDDYIPDDLDDMARPKRSKTGPGDVASAGSSAAGGTGPVEVRTKFPVARIKRIMQADEDVGKVAQVTPVVVSKALELFMISLVSKSAAEARGRSSKRVTAAHLKQAVLKDPQFDFLSEIVGKVADAPAPASDRPDEAGGAEPGEGRKRRPGGGRRKRKDGDDDMT